MIEAPLFPTIVSTPGVTGYAANVRQTAPAVLLAVMVGCSSGSSGGTADGGNGSEAVNDSGLAACRAAGGECVEGVGYCAMVGPGATPGSCLDQGPSTLCCAVSADAGCTQIQASSYDQSCASDSDCLAVSVGDPCMACVFGCHVNVGAISVNATAPYLADVKKTPASVALCGCPSIEPTPVCCRGGKCHADSECLPADADANAADTGGE
jgi:hypothetical protein